MFGRLPLIHRIGLAAVAVVVCVTLGLWAGANPLVPVVTSVGIPVGLALGVLLAWWLVHEGADTARARSTRPRTPHHR